MSTSSALIAGASIAGLALAYWLNHYGWRTTIVERAPRLGTGGQNADRRWAGLEVIRRMGLQEQVRAAYPGALGLEFMRPWVERVQKLPPGTPRMANPTSRAGVALVRAVVRVAGTPVVRRAISRLQQGGTLGRSYPEAGEVPRHGIHIDPVGPATLEIADLAATATF
jgi:2-polyprenyl-6-methoxyphenol hydroxylase-like FAD-dependent oxidoreductase